MQQNQSLLPRGTHLAQVVGFYDIGTQQSTFEGKDTTGRKSVMIYRIKHGEKYHLVPRMNSLTVNRGATLLKDTECLVGPFESYQAAREFDFKNLLGLHAQVVIDHKDSGIKKIHTIKQIVPAPQDGDLPASANELLYFDLITPDMNVFAKLPVWVQRKIESSPEWQALQAA